jgi:hypothetical protein
LKYCEADVSALNDLVLAMAPYIDLVIALYRGAYSVCLAEIKDIGIHIDKKNLDRIRRAWPELLKRLTV